MKVFFELLRLKQWVKNGFVILPFIFSKKWQETLRILWNEEQECSLSLFSSWFQTICAFFAFCFVASGIYILNDWVDRKQDQFHPKKKLRPIPSGRVSLPFAFSLMGMLWLAGLTLVFFELPNLNTFWILLTYLLLNIAYSFKLKHIVILDVMCIALGFVLRVLAGANAIQVPPSFWLLLCTLMLALFLGFCKRRHECVLLQDQGKGEHRQVLEHYSILFLDQMIAVVTTCCLLCYILYTHDPEIRKFHNENLYLTIPFVVYGVFRYLYLVYSREEGGSPTEILYNDPGIIMVCILWILCVCILLLFF